MRILKTTLVANLRYMNGVQIPDIAIRFGPEPDDESVLPVDPNFGIGPTNEWLDLPDDYFMRTKWDGNLQCLAVGRESGFLYLSPKGYNALKPMLREAFAGQEARPQVYFRPRGTWDQFEAAMGKFFDDVYAGTQKRAERLRRKAASIEEAVGAVAWG